MSFVIDDFRFFPIFNDQIELLLMSITRYEPELLINLIWKLGYAPGYALPQPNLDHVNVVILFYFKYSM